MKRWYPRKELVWPLMIVFLSLLAWAFLFGLYQFVRWVVEVMLGHSFSAYTSLSGGSWKSSRAKMENNLPAISDLRQYLDVLGAQVETNGNIDPQLVMTTCRNIALAAADKAKPIPTDVFAPGISDTLMRVALTGLCMAVIQPIMMRGRK